MKNVSAFLSAVLTLGTAAPLSVSAAVLLELRPEVLLDHSRIVLADVAVVHADNALAVTLGAIEIGRAPRVAYVERIGRREIEALVRRRAGALVQELEWRGAHTATVRTHAQLLPSDELSDVAMLAVRGAFPQHQENMRLTLASPLVAVEVPAGTHQIKARLPSGTVLAAHMPVWLDVWVDGAVYRSVVVPITVEVQKAVYVARRRIGAGEETDLNDFDLREQNVAGLGDAAPVAAPLRQTRWRSRLPLQAGQVLTDGSVPLPGAIFRGDEVMLRLRAGVIGVEAHAVALAEAVPGQLLHVRTDSGGALTGRLGNGNVVVIE